MTSDETEKLNQAALEATLGTVQRMAMKISEMAADRREEGYVIVRRNYEEAIRQCGFDPKEPAVSKWLEMTMQGIRAAVTEIGDRSGRA